LKPHAAALLFVVSFATPAQLPAQRKVAAGDRVCVIRRSRNDSLFGRVTSVTSDSLILAAYGRRTALAKRDIDHVDISKGHKSYIQTGALVGLTAGAMGGGIAGAVNHSNCDSNCFTSAAGDILTGALIVGVAGAVVGGAIGALLAHEGWQRAAL